MHSHNLRMQLTSRGATSVHKGGNRKTEISTEDLGKDLVAWVADCQGRAIARVAET